MTITSNDLRTLLDGDSDAVLILVEGRTEVIGGNEVDDDEHRGALRVISRPELVERTGDDDPSERELADQAGALEAAVANLGG